MNTRAEEEKESDEDERDNQLVDDDVIDEDKRMPIFNIFDISKSPFSEDI